VDLVRFELTTSSMPFKKYQSLAGILTENKRLSTTRFGRRWTPRGGLLNQPLVAASDCKTHLRSGIGASRRRVRLADRGARFDNVGWSSDGGLPTAGRAAGGVLLIRRSPRSRYPVSFFADTTGTEGRAVAFFFAVAIFIFLSNVSFPGFTGAPPAILTLISSAPICAARSAVHSAT